jgi:hypothetical protein
MKSKYYQYFSGTWPTFLTFILLALSIAGCETLGPKAIKAGRTDYNSAINKTDVEQLLLNVVRMCANDRPYFLEIASITSTSAMETGIGAESQIHNSGGGTRILAQAR